MKIMEIQIALLFILLLSMIIPAIILIVIFIKTNRKLYESWLDRNPKAKESVLRGIEQAKRGEKAEAPDIEADIAHFEGEK